MFQILLIELQALWPENIRSRGLTGESLHDVTRETLIARFICCPGLVGIRHPS